MTSVTTDEAKIHLSRLLALVEAGEEVIIRRGAVEVAKLVPLTTPRRERPAVGVVTSPPVALSDDAFAPLSDDALAEWGLG